MPWITELPCRDARRIMRPRPVMERRFWFDGEAPHTYLHGFTPAEDITNVIFTSTGTALVEKNHRGRAGKFTVEWAPDDVIAVVVDGSDDLSDDRLLLPGGYMQAHRGTACRVWTVFHRHPSGAHTLMADGVSTAEGRAMLARTAN